MESENLQFLNDIESLLNNCCWTKIRYIVFNIENVELHQNNQMFELSAIEIKNFKITGKIFWIYITPRAFSINNINELNKIEYCYDINSKNQLQNLVEFIGNDSYLIFHNISDYNILVEELKFFNLQIEKYRFRSTQEIGNKIFELKINE